MCYILSCMPTWGPGASYVWARCGQRVLALTSARSMVFLMRKCSYLLVTGRKSDDSPWGLFSSNTKSDPQCSFLCFVAEACCTATGVHALAFASFLVNEQ